MRAIEFQYDLFRKNKLPGSKRRHNAQNPFILQLQEKRFKYNSVPIVFKSRYHHDVQLLSYTKQNVTLYLHALGPCTLCKPIVFRSYHYDRCSTAELYKIVTLLNLSYNS